MERIVNVVESFRKTGLRACKGFGNHRDMGCGLIAHILAKTGKSYSELPNNYRDLAKLAEVSENYAISFTWGFDNKHTRKVCEPNPEFDEAGFADGIQASREVLDAGLFGK